MRIYFSGIGGVGLGPLAEIATGAGYDVLGSDLSHGLMAEKLENSGVVISYDQSGEFLKSEHGKDPINWLVYTSALPETHPELQLAKKLGIKTSKRDELLAHVITEKNLKLLAIAGTHGKTTTTGMLVWALKELGIPVSYSIGTTLSWGPSGAFDPKSEYFVYECDEFDRNFLAFKPYLSLITSLEYDHPDTYKTKDDYKSAFRQFIHESKKVFMWQADAKYINTRDPSAWIFQPNEVLGMSLPGEHNRRNATLVLKVLEFLKIGENQLNLNAVESFRGTNRRFEKLGENLYSDYGHTPTEIKATLQLARELSDHVSLVYQPHQNIRQHEIKDQYTDEIFADAEEIFWLPTYLSREDPNLEILTPEDLTKHLSKMNLHTLNLDDTLLENIQTARRNENLVLCMGAGSIDSWVRENFVV